jgi:hypothetical protein
MDMNEYAVAEIVRMRLADLRADAARHDLAAAARPQRRPLRVTLGLALIRLGEAAAGDAGRRLAANPS